MNRSILDQRPDHAATGPPDVGDAAAPWVGPLVDPRWGDFGDDTSSPTQKSLLAIAGSLLIEISLPKLLFAVTVLLVLPAVLLGIVPLVVTAWLATLSKRLMQLTELGAAYPQAHWIIALHHHLIEYPMPVAALSERIGTALVNGSWFVRKLGPLAVRAVVMHGHRHIEWIGACGALKIVSAPSPVMGSTDDAPTHFHVHVLTAGLDGQLRLLAPERVEIAAAEARRFH
jgi:hypothetical protein